MKTKTHPGVYLPPPIIYVAIFLLSFWLDAYVPLSTSWLESVWCIIAGWVLIALATLLLFSALLRFIQSKNTFVTIKPATSLETSGIYSFSRNPMYLGLLSLYAGMSFLLGNSWTFIFIPILIIIINLYVIRNEEKYLTQKFGEPYSSYRRRTRRWI